jgi:hypothetical protein
LHKAHEIHFSILDLATLKIGGEGKRNNTAKCYLLVALHSVAVQPEINTHKSTFLFLKE